MFAVLRTYNNYLVVNKLQELDQTGLFSELICVINVSQDDIDTPAILNKLNLNTPLRLIQLKNYGWSKALNAAIKSIPMHVLKNDFILCISNEVSINLEQLVKLRKSAEKTNASCGFVHFEGFDFPSFLVPRNTCAIYPGHVFHEIGLFDESLDLSFGMEDYDFVLKCYQEANLLPFIGPKKVGLVIEKDESFYKKIRKEENAIKQIEMRYNKSVLGKIHTRLMNCA